MKLNPDASTPTSAVGVGGNFEITAPLFAPESRASSIPSTRRPSRQVGDQRASPALPNVSPLKHPPRTWQQRNR
jgi:hypothetical protein